MNTEFEVSISSIFLAISLICGCLMWVRRKEVPDRSRTYLALMELIPAGCSVLVLGCVILGYNILQPWTLLEPMKSLAGLYVITLAICYPLEVMRPRQLRGRWLLLLWLPSLVVTLAHRRPECISGTFHPSERGTAAEDGEINIWYINI
jgi:amino acid transporter